MGVTFEWDPAKDEANRRKHGIAFREAIPAFMDPLSFTIPDPDHSTAEERFILLGQDKGAGCSSCLTQIEATEFGS